MKRIFLFLVISFFLPGHPCQAKGHGGGHGGHGGSHSHSGYRTSSSYGSNNRTTGTGTARTTSGIAVNHTAPPHKMADPGPGRKVITATSTPTATGSATGTPGYYGGGYTRGYYGGYYPPEYYNMYYAYNPFFYDPFMMAFGTGFMYSPHYNYVEPSNNGYSEYDDEPINNMPGYVVFENDTLRGKVSITNRGVDVETADADRKYDYSFPNKKEGMKYVTIFNTDSSQLNLARLSDAPKRLLRVVHEGKLNVYDASHKFIYHPEDIDFKTMYIVYNGEGAYLKANSKEDAKIKLTQYVNRAYGMDLDSKNFTWKALLLYMDKLD